MEKWRKHYPHNVQTPHNVHFLIRQVMTRQPLQNLQYQRIAVLLDEHGGFVDVVGVVQIWSILGLRWLESGLNQNFKNHVKIKIEVNFENHSECNKIQVRLPAPDTFCVKMRP